MAAVNEQIIYQPDDRPSHPISFVHGFQDVMTRMAAIAGTTAIVAVAGGQSEGYLSWIFFSALVACGIGHILITLRFWRFGSGYSLSIAASSAFITVSASALVAGGPVMLSALMLISGLIQFVFISRLSLLRRIMTPLVAGTVLMLLSVTVIPPVLRTLPNLPEGSLTATAPVLGGMTLLILLGMRLFTSPKWQQYSPVIAVLVGCVVAIPMGAFDFQKVIDAPWIGIPGYPIADFELSLGAAFWAILPGFVIVNMATMINSISDTVVIQQVAWRRPRATDFRVVQGAHNLIALLNILAAALATLPAAIGASNSARTVLTGVASRRKGVYGGLILIAVAFLPKIVALITAIPRPVLVAYIVFLLALLFVQGMSSVVRGGLDGKKAAVLGVSLWIGIGFENGWILPELLSGTLETLLSNGMTTGAVSVILLSLLLEFISNRRRRLSVDMAASSLPRIDEFLTDYATGASWNEASVNRLRSAGEETLSCLLSQQGDGEEDSGKRLVVSVRRADDDIEMEFAATSEGGNVEDKLAYLSDQPQIQDEEEISFRLLRYYASSVQHHKYHDIDIITVRVSLSS